MYLNSRGYTKYRYFNRINFLCNSLVVTAKALLLNAFSILSRASKMNIVILASKTAFFIQISWAWCVKLSLTREEYDELTKTLCLAINVEKYLYPYTFL